MSHNPDVGALDSEIDIIDIIDNDSDIDAGANVVDTKDNAGGPSLKKRKRDRSRSPGSQQFMRDLAAAIERPRVQATSAPQPPNVPAVPNSPEHRVKSEPPSFIQQFFTQYPEYKYNPAGETMSQFQQMSQSFNWKREDPEMKEAQRRLRIALTEDFNRMYGTDLVKSTFVNLVDLVDTQFTKEPVRHFADEAALRQYSREHSKIFPKEEAYAGGLLKYLLRRIFSSGPPKKRGGPGPRKKRRKVA